MNSFKFVKDALAYEIERQVDLIEDGGKVIQETRLFDTSKGITVAMRTKEEAHDYRYFPEPDLLPLIVEDSLINEAKKDLPELPMAKKDRFISEYSIPAYDAGVLTSSKELAGYFENVAKRTREPKISSNWIMGELLRLLKEDGRDVKDCPVTPEALAALIGMIKKGAVSTKMAKDVFSEMYSTGKPPEEVVKEMGVSQISDEAALVAVIDKVMADNAESVERFRAGEEKLLGFFVGQTMKATKGQANPQVVNKVLKERLKG